MSDKWDGEARGCADVIFSRIQILMRTNDFAAITVDDLYTSVLSLVTHCEKNDVRLADILEDVYLQLKEETNEKRKNLG